MRDGLYKVEFQTPLGKGAGVIHITGDRLWGGDSGIFYVGAINRAGDSFSAEVTADRHTFGIESVFGKDRVHISLRGTHKNDIAQVTGSAIEAPGISFQARLSRLSD